MKREILEIIKPLERAVYEVRLFFGPGYKVYYGLEDQKNVILLAGGDKKTQTKDVKRAQGFWGMVLQERR